MIKKLSIVSITLILFAPVFWNWEDVINELEKKAEQEKVKELNETFTLKKFQTKERFENFILDKVYDKVIDSCSKRYYPQPYYRYYKMGWDIMLKNSVADKDMVKSTSNHIVEWMWWEDEVSYWDTNLQKKWVDEPEIIKLSKDNIAYYNQKDNKIYIIKSPNNNWTLDIDSVNIQDTIKIPSLIWKHSVQMFYVDDKLVVVGSRYSQHFWWNITDVVFYNIKDGKASFDRLVDIKWNYKDARIIDWRVYIITNYSFSNLTQNICNNIYKDLWEKIKNLEKKDFDYSKIQEEFDKLLQEYKKNIDKKELLEVIKNKLIQKSIDMKIDKNTKYKFNWKDYPLDIDIISPSLDNIIFLPTNFDNLNIYNLRFNIVNIIDIDKKEKSSQYVIFWNMSNGVIHATKDSLYLVNNYYIDYNWTCPMNIKCMCALPYYYRGNFTLIHKFSINWKELNYIDSSVISWQPINQYSMDEDTNWNFRIFTKSTYPNRKTELFTFDNRLKLLGMINDIAPGEELKSSRFIEDKAYLVTFKTTDPLFVIDLQDHTNPKIIWKLKIPWYSLYLHPYKKVASKQYLIGIWQQAEAVSNYYALPKNIKIDLYEIDYASTSWDYIKVIQKYKKVIWNEEKTWSNGSYTPVFDNPRSFINYNNEDGTINILLPVYLVEDRKTQRCTVNYIWKDGERIEDGEECYTNYTKLPYFIGIKGFNIDENNWITEIISKNYIELYDKAGEKDINQYNYRNENHRVSYYSLWKDIVPFLINNNFLDMFKGKENQTVIFNDKFKVKLSEKRIKEDINTQCYYKKPAPWTITCEMYCWKRWVLQDDWNCEQIKVSAACSCPWFETKDQCEKECKK